MTNLTIHVTPAPADPTRQTEWPFGYPCGCNLEVGFCDRHRGMVRVIHAVWRNGSKEAVATLWALADGYGEPGATPAQGYDWSGIRDSTPTAIERMAFYLEGLEVQAP